MPACSATSKATLVAFLQNMLGQGQLGTLDGSLPFNVLCSLVNNPFTRTSLGYVQADVQVQYQAINEKFIVNLQGRANGRGGAERRLVCHRARGVRERVDAHPARRRPVQHGP